MINKVYCKAFEALQIWWICKMWVECKAVHLPRRYLIWAGTVILAKNCTVREKYRT